MIKKLFFGTVPVQNLWGDLVLFLARVFTGLAMALAHGAGKVPPPERFISGIEEMGFPMPLVFAWAAGLAEYLGGFLLALGLLTRPAAFSIAFTMAVAGFVRHAADPFEMQERAFLFLALSVIFLVFGGGRFSLDRFLRK